VSSSGLPRCRRGISSHPALLLIPAARPCSSSLLHVPAPHCGYPGSTSPWLPGQYLTVGIPAVHHRGYPGSTHRGYPGSTPPWVSLSAIPHRGYPSVLYLTVGSMPAGGTPPWVACRQEVHHRR